MDYAIVSFTKKLGYTKLKDEQNKHSLATQGLVCSLISGRDVFGVLPVGLVNPCIMLAYH